MSPSSPLHVLRSGLEPGPDTEALVLVHGYGASSFTWRHWLPALERAAHVVRVDLLGCGGSEMPAQGPYDPEGQSALLLDILSDLATGEQHRPRGITLVGHSLGGGIALLTALAMQGRGTPARGLVVVGGAAYPQRLPPFVRLAHRPRLAHALMDLVPRGFLIEQVLRSIVFDAATVTDEVVEGYTRPLLRDGAVQALLQSATHIEPAGLDGIVRAYPGLTTPSLLLWGRHDRVVPPWVGARLAGDLPSARLHILERCGHLPQEEVPEASLTPVLRFLDR